MTDFEAGLQNALSDVYPEAERNACLFHYVQVRAPKHVTYVLVPT